MLGGYRHVADFTGAEREGYGLRQGTIFHGRRDSTATAYLHPAMKRPNLTVLTRAQVQRLEVQGGRATGVVLSSAAGTQTLQADREVLLCAGAIHSPQLLMLSGIGPAQHLEAMGIEVKSGLDGVGANYQEHPALQINMEMRDTTSYGLSLRTLPRAAWNLLEYVAARRGPLASNVFESTAFVRSAEGLDRPDIQIPFQPARRNPDSVSAAAGPWVCNERGEPLPTQPWPGTARQCRRARCATRGRRPVQRCGGHCAHAVGPAPGAAAH